ncbi:MAG TPA: hypothetical protein VF556_17650 [Pyrinomonadaceae bacterium]|jgi:hypothetical protein
MEIASPVIPGEDHEERIIAKDQPQYLPLPVIELGGGVMIARWTLNEEERRVVAETGNIYMIMLTFNNPVMPHTLFVEKPNIAKLKEHYGRTNDPSQGNKAIVSNNEEDKDKSTAKPNSETANRIKPEF